MKIKILLIFLFASSLTAQVQIGKNVKIGGAGSGTGTVTTVSGGTANGLTVNVASPSTTPVVTVGPDGTHVIPVNTGSASLFLGQDGLYHAGGSSSPLTTKGDLYGFSSTNARLPVGSNGLCLVADSTQTLGIGWTSCGGGGLSGQTINCAPKANSATTSTSSLPLCDPSGTLTSTDPIAAPSFIAGTPSSGALAALPSGAHGSATDESSTSGVPAAGVDYIRASSTGHGYVISENGGAEARICDATNSVCGGGSPAFNAITSGTNTTAAMVVGSGASLRVPTQSFGDNSTLAASDAFVLANVTPVSLVTKYMSLACSGMQNADPNAGGGTDATSCINALFAVANPTTAIDVVQDQGFSLVSGNGILCPAGGNCILEGHGGGIATTQITNCFIGSGVAIFTAANTLTAGQTGTLSDLTHCPTLTNTTVVVLSAGLSSSQFEVVASGSVASGAETGTFRQIYGTGFYLAANSKDIFSNGPWGSGSTCDVGAGAIASQGANIQVLNLVLNGNAPNQTNYCFGVDINNINGVTLRDVIFYNAARYSVKVANVSQMIADGNQYFSTSPLAGTNTDGIHIEGPASDFKITNSSFKTSDDAIALNAYEGYCGPITRVAIDNVHMDNAFNAVRLYNLDLNTCGNGTVPLISNVDIGHMTGPTLHWLTFGAGATPVGTLNPAVTNVHIHDSSFSQTSASLGPVLIQDNIGTLSFDNIDWDSPTYPQFLDFGSVSTAYFQTISIHNLQIRDTAAGSAFSNLLASGAPLVGQSLNVDGLGIIAQGASPAAVTCLFCGPATGSTISQLLFGNIDPSNIYIAGGNTGFFGSTPISSALIPGIYPSVHAAQQLFSFDGTNLTLDGNFNLAARTLSTLQATVSGLASGNCVQASTGGLLTTTGSPCGGGGVTNPIILTASNPYISLVNTGASNVPSYFGTYASGTHSGLFQFAYNRNPATGVIGDATQTAAWVNVQGSSSGPSSLAVATQAVAAGAFTYPLYVDPTGIIVSGVIGLGTAPTYDTGLSRGSAGVVDVGNGTAGDTSGSMKMANLTDSALTSGNCVQASTGGLLADSGQPCVTRLAHYWNVQPGLFATATMLGPAYIADSTPSGSAFYFVVRLSGTISCTTGPTVNIMDLGTSPTTAYGSATSAFSQGTGTSDGVYFTNSPVGTILGGHYYGLAFSAGTCVTAPTVDVTLNW